jgi:FkbM family methyltransferase
MRVPWFSGCWSGIRIAPAAAPRTKLAVHHGDGDILGLKSVLKPLAARLGILEWRNARARARHHVQIAAAYPAEFFETAIRGRQLRFRTESPREKVWFHSRYKTGDLHEPAATEALLARIRADDNFLDIGSYFGWYSCVAAVAAPKGRVLAVELDQDNFSVLAYNVAYNRLWNIETVQAGAFDSNQDVRVPRDPFSVSPERAIATGAEAGGVAVRAIVLDDMLEAKGFRPSFVKIDVEGAETAVLRGLRKTLQRDQPTLLVEIHSEKLRGFGSSTGEVVELLGGLGYRVEVFTDHRGAGALVPLPAGYAFGENEMVLAASEGRMAGADHSVAAASGR